MDGSDMILIQQWMHGCDWYIACKALEQFHSDNSRYKFVFSIISKRLQSNSMRNSCTLVLALALMIISLANSDLIPCKPHYRSTNITSNTIVLSISPPQGQFSPLSTSSYAIPMASPAIFAFAIQSIQAVTPLLNWKLLPTSNTNSIKIDFIHQTWKWSLLKVGYWQSDAGTSLLEMGWINAPSQQIKKNQKEQNSYYVVGKPNSNYKGIDTINDKVIMTFINGVSFEDNTALESKPTTASSSTTTSTTATTTTQDQPVCIVTTSATLSTSNTFSINFTVIHFGKANLAFVAFSYIIFAPEKIALASYGGVLSLSQLQSQHSSSIMYLLQQPNTVSLFGFNSLIVAPSPALTAISLSVSLKAFTLSLKTSKIAYLQVGYIFMGTSPKQICSEVPECILSGEIYLSEGKCVKQCNQDEKLKKLWDGAQQCIKDQSKTSAPVATSLKAIVNASNPKNATTIVNPSGISFAKSLTTQILESPPIAQSPSNEFQLFLAPISNAQNLFFSLSFAQPPLTNKIHINFPAQYTPLNCQITSRKIKKNIVDCLCGFPNGVLSRQLSFTAEYNGKAIAMQFTPKGRV